jgi:hypothetical protein
MKSDFCLAQLRHAYAQLAAGEVVDQKAFADGLLAPAIKHLETKTEAPWHVAMNHWGIPDILQEVEEGVKWDLTVNGVPHRYICKQVDYEQAHQIVNAHNAAMERLVKRDD